MPDQKENAGNFSTWASTNSLSLWKPPTLEDLHATFRLMQEKYRTQPPNQIILSRGAAVAIGMLCALCEGEETVESLGGRMVACHCAAFKRQPFDL